MRRWPMALALGLFCVQTASAQQATDEDYTPDYSSSFHPDSVSTLQYKRKSAALHAEVMSRTPKFAQGGGQNVDASLLDEVEGHKSLLTWRGLFSEPTWLEWYEPKPPPVQFPDGHPCLEILNYLCFFDVLSPATVGPEVRWTFSVPEPAPEPSLREEDSDTVGFDETLSMAWIKSNAPVFFTGPGANTDSSCLEEVRLNKSHISLEYLFSSEEDEEGIIIGWSVRGNVPSTSSYLRLLNALDFLGILDPAKIGPNMGPWFMEPEPTPSPSGYFCSGFFR